MQCVQEGNVGTSHGEAFRERFKIIFSDCDNGRFELAEARRRAAHAEPERDVEMQPDGDEAMVDVVPEDAMSEGAPAPPHAPGEYSSVMTVIP